MVPAGLTGQVVDEVATRLEPGDVIIDGGNSYYRNDVDRAARLRELRIHFVDVGTSGGVFGLERGFSLMVGGETDVVRDLEPIFKALAPGVEAAGALVAVVSAAATAVVSQATGASTHPLQDTPEALRNFVSVLDGFTVTIALGAGIAAMVVFGSERGTTAVGVGISITTIPAAAYVGIAVAAGSWSEALSGAIVLIVNVVCVLGAEVFAGMILRGQINRRARELESTDVGVRPTER